MLCIHYDFKFMEQCFRCDSALLGLSFELSDPVLSLCMQVKKMSGFPQNTPHLKSFEIW